MHTLHGVVMAIAEGRKGPAKGGVLDGEQATRLRALLAEHGQGALPSESGTVRGLARLLRRNPTDAERILWQALTTDRRFAGQFKRQTPVGRHIPDFVSFVHRIAIELINPDETDVIAKDRAARQAWLEARATGWSTWRPPMSKAISLRNCTGWSRACWRRGRTDSRAPDAAQRAASSRRGALLIRGPSWRSAWVPALRSSVSRCTASGTRDALPYPNDLAERAAAMPSAFMREASVVGLMSSSSAAPPGPNTLPLLARKRGQDVAALAVAQLGRGQHRRPASAFGAPAPVALRAGGPAGRCAAGRYAPGWRRARSRSAVRGHCRASRSAPAAARRLPTAAARTSVRPRSSGSAAASSGMSSRRSRSGTRLDRKHVEPEIQVLAKFAARALPL